MQANPFVQLRSTDIAAARRDERLPQPFSGLSGAPAEMYQAAFTMPFVIDTDPEVPFDHRH